MLPVSSSARCRQVCDTCGIARCCSVGSHRANSHACATERNFSVCVEPERDPSDDHDNGVGAFFILTTLSPRAACNLTARDQSSALPISGPSPSVPHWWCRADHPSESSWDDLMFKETGVENGVRSWQPSHSSATARPHVGGSASASSGLSPVPEESALARTLGRD